MRSEQIQILLDKIAQAVTRCPELGSELRRVYGGQSELPIALLRQLDNNLQDVQGTVGDIYDLLRVEPCQSIPYGFVKDDKIRQQLEKDNLQMEQEIINLEQRDYAENYDRVCVWAFRQVEAVLRYAMPVLRPYCSATAQEALAKEMVSARSMIINLTCEFRFYMIKYQPLHGLRVIRNRMEHPVSNFSEVDVAYEKYLRNTYYDGGDLRRLLLLFMYELELILLNPSSRRSR
ncbi:MAG: hypothetical protein SPK09_03195 [Porphyromonas sp.]|nr:hypothetical protein [Porphyromonas sp.]